MITIKPVNVSFIMIFILAAGGRGQEAAPKPRAPIAPSEKSPTSPEPSTGVGASTGAALHQAVDEPQPGFVARVLSDASTIYVAPAPFAVQTDVLAVEALEGAIGTLAVTLSRPISIRGRVAIITDDSVRVAPQVLRKEGEHRLLLTGLSGEQLTTVRNLLSPMPRVPEGPHFLVAGPTRPVKPGRTVSVDVTLGDIEDLKAVQVALDAAGGSSGMMVLERILVDDDMPDFVFSGKTAFRATDLDRGRAVAALLEGGISVPRESYFATYVYRLSPDASGVFRVSIRVGSDTLLRDSRGNGIAYQAGPPVAVVVEPRADTAPPRPE